jgi:hypothetical protein
MDKPAEREELGSNGLLIVGCELAEGEDTVSNGSTLGSIMETGHNTLQQFPCGCKNKFNDGD